MAERFSALLCLPLVVALLFAAPVFAQQAAPQAKLVVVGVLTDAQSLEAADATVKSLISDGARFIEIVEGKVAMAVYAGSSNVPLSDLRDAFFDLAASSGIRLGKLIAVETVKDRLDSRVQEVIAELAGLAGVPQPLRPVVAEIPPVSFELAPGSQSYSVDAAQAGIAVSEIQLFLKSQLPLPGKVETRKLAAASYSPKNVFAIAADVPYETFSMEVSPEAAALLDKAFLEFSVQKQWLAENGIDVSSVVLRRLSEATGDWEAIDALPFGEDADFLFFRAELSRFSIYSIVGTSPPLLCSVCERAEWSECHEGVQTRVANICDESTAYACRPSVQTRQCESPAAAPPAFPVSFELVAMAAIAIAIGAYLVGRRRS
jgi:PGF-pre-PGF domain-containing protein